MQLDAAGEQFRKYEGDDYKGEYIPGYDPDTDPEAHKRLFYDADLRLASKNYWAGVTGQETPPPPEYWPYYGRMRLCRLLDVYGAQAQMRRAQHAYRRFNYTVIAGVVIFAVCIFESAMILAVLAGILGVVALGIGKLVYGHQYGKHYDAQKRALAAGEAVWVPYDRWQLQKMKTDNFYLWP